MLWRPSHFSGTVAVMDVQEERVFHRPRFDPKGVIVARRDVTLDERSFAPLDEIPGGMIKEERTLRILWETYQVDTYPPGSKRVREGRSWRWVAGNGETRGVIQLGPAKRR
jgi:hypothetical protein